MFKEVHITELPDKFPSTSHRNLCIIEESAQGIVGARSVRRLAANGVRSARNPEKPDPNAHDSEARVRK